MKEKKKQLIIWSFMTAAFVLFSDLVLKSHTEAQDPKDFPKEMKGSHGLILLYKNHDPGFMYGFLKEWPGVIRKFPLVVLIVDVLCLCRELHQSGKKNTAVTPAEFAAVTGISMVIGGNLSNLYDRWIRHYVVDYFSIQIGFLKKTVFNLGDMGILFGTLLFGAGIAAEAEKEKRAR